MPGSRRSLRPAGIAWKRVKPATRANPVTAIGGYTGLLDIQPRTDAARSLSEDLWKWVRKYLRRRTRQVSHPPIADETLLLDTLVKEMEVSIEKRTLRDRTDFVLSRAIRLLRDRSTELRARARAGPHKDSALAQSLPAFAECCWRHNPRATEDQILELAAAVLVVTGIKGEGATSSSKLRKLIWPPVSDEEPAQLSQFTLDWSTLKKRAAR